MGASGAVFGLYAVAAILKLRFNFKKLVEFLVLGQFVVKQVLQVRGAFPSRCSSNLPTVIETHHLHVSPSMEACLSRSSPHLDCLFVDACPLQDYC
jgi:hypothetical protein